MKRLSIISILFLLVIPLHAQKYEITFELPKRNDSILYLAQHFRDGYIILDSARLVNPTIHSYPTVTFRGKRKFETGIYVVINSRDAKKGLFDFTIDGSQKFTIEFTPALDAIEESIKGSPANQAMYKYINCLEQAKSRSRDIDKRKKSPDAKVRDEANRDMQLLTNEMNTFDSLYFIQNKKYRFSQILAMMKDPQVPEGVTDEVAYYCTHYWDNVDLTDHSLTRTPHLFDKMNYYFFGVLFHADKDTICKYADMVLHRIEDDTVMLRYFLDYIMPKYYRSTKNVGWDATWCHLVREYYLKGKCAWAKPSEIANKRKTCEFLEKSLIGAPGAEIWMADTSQSNDPKDWISSHRFPQKYVILWFWDPDCHHCQEQTASLKVLYDSLSAADNKIFEVYAVGYEADVDKWKRYVRDHQLPFVNVGGSNVNIDYQEAYNVHGAPTMIILNEERRIIMNKTIPTKSILPFLRRYEESRKRTN